MRYTSKRDIPSGSRVLVAMSGGVDSSVAAHRLKSDGFDIVGVTMNLRSDESSVLPVTYEDAVRVAKKIGIPHHVLNLGDYFEEKVMGPTRREYARGRTPNPCVLCNRFLKFDLLFRKAGEFGCSYIATGHYARVVRDSSGYHLLRGIDPEKDQTYFLSYLTENKLDKILFPLGWDTKVSIRKEAADIGLGVADRPESQDLCFFTSGTEGLKFGDKVISEKPGEIISTDGKVLGHHDGISGFTIGQRKGVPGGMPERMYVIEIDPVTNRVVVGTDEECMTSEFSIEEISLIGGDRDRMRAESGEVQVQVRYRTMAVAGKIKFLEEKSGTVELEFPVRAVTPGQIAVLYAGEEVLGAGVIDGVGRG